jgi:hypothetical protein
MSLRLVERILVPLRNERWTKPVLANVADWWAEAKMRDFVQDVAIGSVNYLRRDHAFGQQSPWQERLTPNQGLGFATRLDETMRSAAELCDELDAGSLQHREATLLAERVASAEAWTKALEDERRRFGVLLDRAARQRNAVVHGADTVPEVIASIADFVVQLRSMLVHAQLDAAKKGESVGAYLERMRLRLERAADRLARGIAPVDAIFKKSDEAEL